METAPAEHGMSATAAFYLPFFRRSNGCLLLHADPAARGQSALHPASPERGGAPAERPQI
jgi:hypothetical protein